LAVYSPYISTNGCAKRLDIAQFLRGSRFPLRALLHSARCQDTSNPTFNGIHNYTHTLIIMSSDSIPSVETDEASTTQLQGLAVRLKDPSGALATTFPGKTAPDVLGTNPGTETKLNAQDLPLRASSEASSLPSRAELEAALASKDGVIGSKNETIAIKDAVILALQKEVSRLQAENTSHKRKHVNEDWIKPADGPYVEVYQPEALQHDTIEEAQLEQIEDPEVALPSFLQNDPQRVLSSHHPVPAAIAPPGISSSQAKTS
jgi:hypothetical protein